jgi:hypothetical protein
MMIIVACGIAQRKAWTLTLISKGIGCTVMKLLFENIMIVKTAYGNIVVPTEQIQQDDGRTIVLATGEDPIVRV